MIKVSTCTMGNNMSKVNGKYLIFKTRIVKMKLFLLIDNRSKTELINKFFMYANKIPFFELKKLISFILKNDKVV